MKNPFAFFVGLFLALGVAALAWLSLVIARNDFLQPGGYALSASFNNCNGLRKGSPILVAGVEVGRVRSIELKNYEALVTFSVQEGLPLPIDTIASIRTKGLIGEKFIELSPGAEDALIPPGGTIRQTEPTMDIESMISKYIQGSVPPPAPAGGTGGASAP